MELSNEETRRALRYLSSVPEELRNDPDVVEMASGIAKSSLHEIDTQEVIGKTVLAKWQNARALRDSLVKECEVEQQQKECPGERV